MTPTTEELKALLDAATDGRWESMATADLSLFVVRDGNDGEELIASVNTCNPHDANLLALAPTLAARVVALETALKGVLSVIDRPQSGPTICMSAEDAINSAANGLDLRLAAMGARAILEDRA